MEFLTKEKHFNFEENLKQQLKPLSATPFEWIDTAEAL